MKLYTIILFAALAAIGCKSQENTATSNKSAEQKAASTSTEVSAEVEPGKSSRVAPQVETATDLKPVLEPADAQSGQNQTDEPFPVELPENLFAMIERSACFGRCPTYKVQIFNDGKAVYSGQANVKKIGEYRAKISSILLDSFQSQALAIDYFNLRNRYDGQITDIPSTITAIQFDGKSKVILSRYRSPKALIEFEQFFDEMVDGLQWQKIAE